MGLSRAEFLRMSPREFFALCKRNSDQVEREDRRFATLQAVICQCHGAKVTADDFMGKVKKTTKKKPKFPTDKQLERQLEAVFGCGPATAKKVRKP